MYKQGSAMDTSVESNVKNAKTTKLARQEPPALDPSQFNGIMQIRDILLGDHISNWENRLSKVERDMQAAFKQTDARLSEMDQRVDDFVGKAEKKLKEIEEQSTKFSQQADTRLKAMDERIAQADKNLKEELETNLMDLEQENTDLRALVDEFKADLMKSLDELKGQKLDRQSLAAAFTQFAESLSQAEM